MAKEQLTGEALTEHVDMCATAEGILQAASAEETAHSEQVLRNMHRRDPMVWLALLFARLHKLLVQDFPLPGSSWQGEEVMRLIIEILNGECPILWGWDEKPTHAGSQPLFQMRETLFSANRGVFVRFSHDRLHCITQWQLVELLIAFATQRMTRQVIAEQNELSPEELAFLVTHNKRANELLMTLEATLAYHNVSTWFTEHQRDILGDKREPQPLHRLTNAPLVIGTRPLVTDVALYRRTGQAVRLIPTVGLNHTDALVTVRTGFTTTLSRPSFTDHLYSLAPSPAPS